MFSVGFSERKGSCNGTHRGSDAGTHIRSGAGSQSRRSVDVADVHDMRLLAIVLV